MSAGTVWRFADCELDPGQRRLQQSGVAMHLPPKTYELLALLVAHGGRLLTRERLLGAVWQETHVSDANLTNTIAALRKLLGAGAIETVSKQGYRFNLPITVQSDASRGVVQLMEEGKKEMALRTVESTSRAQRLFWLAIAERPDYPEAWAWLARVSRFLEKYRTAPEHNRKLAEAAFRRSFALDPDLPSAHQFYSAFQTDCGEAVPAMKRLLERVKKFPDDALSYAGLVLACRFAGLLKASAAAHEKAIGIDAAVTTSLPHTHFAGCEYRLVIASYAVAGSMVQAYLDAAAWAALEAREVEEEIAHRLARKNLPPLFEALLNSLRHTLRGEADAVSAICRTQDVTDDPETALYFSRHLAKLESHGEALDMLRLSVKGGMTIPFTLESDPWLRPLASELGFLQLKREAADRHEWATGVFREAGGERLLGMQPQARSGDARGA